MPQRPADAVAGVSLLALLFAAPLSADEPGPVEPLDEATWDASHRPAERMLVIGSKDDRRDIPGAATFIGEEEIETFQYEDVLRMLRLAPGVNIQEEDGFGLRPNIGLRGTSVERSEKITLMEDGVLIAPAPYAAPAAYFFPTAGRMEGIEVRKGSAAIKFGPRTVGGAINLLSRSIPEDYQGFIEGRFGERDNFTIHAAGGGQGEHVGFVAETFQSGSNGFKRLTNDPDADTGFRIEDYMAKLRVNTDRDADIFHSFEVKAGYTRNDSNETYLGLTDADFEADPFQRYAASQLDRIESEHYQVRGTYYGEYGDNVDLTVVGYYNNFYRSWFKLDDLDFGDGRFRPSDLYRGDAFFQGVLSDLRGTDVGRAEAAAERARVLDVLRGTADSPDDALQLRNNNRDYYSAGVQAIVGWRVATGPVGHEIEASLRYHRDQEDRVQNRENFRMDNASLVATSVDPLGTQANRLAEGEAVAAFIQDTISWGRFRFVPGLRVESIDLTRTDFATGDPERTTGATGIRRNSITELVPGFGAFFDATESLTLLAGVHKGFNPPGASDAEADSETSVNYEAGALFERGAFSAEVIGFYSDVSNLLGTCSNSAGPVTGECEIGDQFNGGAVDVVGLELAGAYRAATPIAGVSAPVSLNYTFTDAEFQSSFADGFWGDVAVGDALPYIPQHQFTVSAGLESAKWSLNLLANYVGDVRTEAGQGAIPADQRVDSRIVFDLAAAYFVAENVRLHVTVNNLFDNDYAVARRPYGLRPGRPQTIIGGLTVDF
ncbi:hypothetical protein CCR80_01835 [Rhodothalassium salexigens]|uniref:TonB-dependent receptor family protein n=1 Tax=Rhodothalassium salexigens TaxID=1086 RepID=UPI0019130A87|nr:TonB-dependent receptor [Rhodothalassium salexigens]MBK5919777.1 hypothetical protein [Rhodothalassium salexigens]